MKRQFFVFMMGLIASIGLVTAVGCGETTNCTALGCTSSFELNFPSDHNWETGSWTVTIDADGEQQGSCDLDLPQATGGSDPSCTGGLDIVLNSSGDGIARVTQRLGSGSVESAPENVSVELQRDQQEVASQTLQPEFRASYPNGEDCPAACYEVSEQFTF